jgi:hypothetical protein
MSFDCSFSTPGIDYELWIDDDDRVCYAYLREADGRICADVWLYNRGPSPEQFEDSRGVPPRNPARFVADVRFPLPNSPDDFSAQWWREGGVLYARVFIRKALVGILAPGIKPGWSIMAKKDGPVAKVLASSSESDLAPILREIRALPAREKDRGRHENP